ncbi:MAG: hypothetical protein SFU56_11730 [Capsulimonadales bacterium]|nr:hypothetical protein [Capsulimonadales bacterium]
MKERWRIEGDGVVWDVATEPRLPHEDHVEMSGRKVSVIVRYRVDENRHLRLTREVIWPMLRLREGDVRGYLRRTVHGLPVVATDGRLWEAGTVRRVFFDGRLTVDFDPQDGLAARLTLSVQGDYVEATLTFSAEQGPSPSLSCPETGIEMETGVYGEYEIRRWCAIRGNEAREMILATLSRPGLQPFSSRDRTWLIREVRDEKLVLETPDPVLNTAFSFAKLRAAESLFETKMGLVHSPGGGRYYGGVWNNDQCEYANPFFAYLGEEDARLAALTAFRNFVPYMTTDYTPIPSSLEMEGTIAWCGARDRGDAAMYASGATRYALALGDRAIAEELYTPIAWCLEYCRRKVNDRGVVASDSDELENRFPSGDANLSTACLYYDGLRRAADLAADLNRAEDAANYDHRASELAGAIEAHFGATVEGFETYRYYDGNTTLRAWICLPLAFGVGGAPERTAGTLDALFSPKLWSVDGLATESGKPDFWDRSTLYALRGAFFAGDTERAFAHLTAYSRRRLLGEHIPYAVEASPEGGQAHLSAESALYARVIVEGMFGFVPIGLRSFILTPRLPDGWNRMALRRFDAFGHRFDIEVERRSDKVSVRITDTAGAVLSEMTGDFGRAFGFRLP